MFRPALHPRLRPIVLIAALLGVISTVVLLVMPAGAASPPYEFVQAWGSYGVGNGQFGQTGSCESVRKLNCHVF
jgi:hypothetical protein